MLNLTSAVQMFTRRLKQQLPKRITIATFFVAPLALAFFLANNPAETASAQTKRRTTTGVNTARPSRYSQFSHAVAAHKMECSACHQFPSQNWKTVRPEADAFPDITEYPKHESCLNCHKQQFFRGAKPPICSVCHINPSPRDSRRHPFPNPREIFDASLKGRSAISDFDINFPHAIHVDIVSQLRRTSSPFQNASFAAERRAEESCSVCHKTLHPQGDGGDEYMTKPPADLGDGFWLKKGTFKSSPTGHATCFTCHSADSGMSPSPMNCGTCHALKQKMPPPDFDPALASKMGVTEKVVLDAWRERDSSGKYRHEWFSHAELSCSTCHNVEKMNTLDPATKKVSLASCSTCHATATVDDGGALNFEAEAKQKDPKFECTKCHIVFGRQTMPASHVEALKAATGKLR